MVVLDTNIILEILDKRPKWQQVRAALQAHQAEEIAVTILTLCTVLYVAERHGKQKLPLVEKLLKSFKVIDDTVEDAAWAYNHYKQDDFEDALQAAAAIREGCSTFITLDKDLAKKYRTHLSIELIS